MGKVFYNITDARDGSASIDWFPSLESMQFAQALEELTNDEGFAETTDGWVEGENLKPCRPLTLVEELVEKAFSCLSERCGFPMKTRKAVSMLLVGDYAQLVKSCPDLRECFRNCDFELQHSYMSDSVAEKWVNGDVILTYHPEEGIISVGIGDKIFSRLS